MPGGSTNYRALTVTGSLKMDPKDYVSVFLYSENDNSWTAQTESGFSCQRFSTKVGFHAVKWEDQGMGQGFTELNKWRVTERPTLYSVGGGFKDNGAKYAPPSEGAYFCYFNLRFDNLKRMSGTKVYFRSIISVNGDRDFNNGLHATEGDHASTDKRHMNVAGTLWLKVKDTVSVLAYSSEDPSYRLSGDSGWGCHLMKTDIGFHTNLKEDQSMSTGWRGS